MGHSCFRNTSPAGAGKTRMLAAAVDDLERQGRPVFGVAPTAKAARVLEAETRMPTDTVAKLLHEWRRDDRPARPGLPPAGRRDVGRRRGRDAVYPGAARHRRTRRSQPLATRARRRPTTAASRGRGGLFDERLRDRPRRHPRTPPPLPTPLGSQRVTPTARRRPDSHRPLRAPRPHPPQHIRRPRRTHRPPWLDHTAAGRSVGIVASTNEHADRLNRAVQLARHIEGQLGSQSTSIAGGEVASRR